MVSFAKAAEDVVEIISKTSLNIRYQINISYQREKAQHFRLVLLLVAVSIYIKLLCFRNLVQIIIMRRTTHTYRHIIFTTIP